MRAGWFANGAEECIIVDEAPLANQPDNDLPLPLSKLPEEARCGVE